MAQGSGDFDALARQYWGLWGDVARGASTPGMDAGVQGMRDALAAWTRAASVAQGGIDGPLSHFNRQAGDWLAQMQQVAAQFAGRAHSAEDIGQAWQRMLGGNAFQGLFQGMRGAGLQDIGEWSEAAGPWLQGLRTETAGLLGMPAFGFAREHQERLQALAQAQLRWQDALAAYNALMARVSQDAHARFQARLAEREAPGRQLTSVRALFDLWVDAAEDAYAEAALSPDYRKAYGELVNAQMRLRADAQAIAEQAAQLAGLPGRSELDGAHRRLAELERQVRRMQREHEAATVANGPSAAPAPSSSRPRRTGGARAPAAAPAPAPTSGKPAAKARRPAPASPTTIRKAVGGAARKAGKPPTPARGSKQAGATKATKASKPRSVTTKTAKTAARTR